MTTENYQVLPSGFAKIQLLPLNVMFGPQGLWHAKDEHELAGAIAANAKELGKLANNENINPQTRRLISEAITRPNLTKAKAAEFIGRVNSAAFRTAGSSTMQWSVWKHAKGKKGLSVEKRTTIPTEHLNLPRADVFFHIGDDLFADLSKVTREATSGVIGAIDKARELYPDVDVEELRRNAGKVAQQQIFAPKGRKSLMKVDYKLVKTPKGVKAAVIDVSSELVGIGATDLELTNFGLPKRLLSTFAMGLLKMHLDQNSGKLPNTILLMVRDKQMAEGPLKTDIDALRNQLTKTIKQFNPNAEVKIALQESVRRSSRTKPEYPFKVQTTEGKSVTPDLVIRYGRFPMTREEDAALNARGVKVMDKSDYVIAADKTANGHVLNLLKLEPEGTVFVPKNDVSPHTIFQQAFQDKVDQVMDRARIEGWNGVVVKFPTKLAPGGTEIPTAFFVNPHSPLQISAVKDEINDIAKRAASLPETEKKKAVPTFEELVPSTIPEVGGRGVEIRTLAMPRMKIGAIQRIVVHE